MHSYVEVARTYISGIAFLHLFSFLQNGTTFQVSTQGQGLSGLLGAALFGSSGLEGNKRIYIHMV